MTVTPRAAEGLRVRSRQLDVPTPRGTLPVEIYTQIFEYLSIVDLKAARLRSRLFDQEAKFLLRRSTVTHGFGLKPHAQSNILSTSLHTQTPTESLKVTRLVLDIGALLSCTQKRPHWRHVWQQQTELFIGALRQLDNLDTVEFTTSHRHQPTELPDSVILEFSFFVDDCLAALIMAERSPRVLRFRGEHFPIPSSLLGTSLPAAYFQTHQRIAALSALLHNVRTLVVCVREPSRHLGVPTQLDDPPQLCLAQGLFPQVLAAPPTKLEHLTIDVDIEKPCAVHATDGGSRFALFDNALGSTTTLPNLKILSIAPVYIPASDLVNFIARHQQLQQLQLVCASCIPTHHPLFWNRIVSRVGQTLGDEGLGKLRLTLKCISEDGRTSQCGWKCPGDVWWDYSGAEELKNLGKTIVPVDLSANGLNIKVLGSQNCCINQ